MGNQNLCGDAGGYAGEIEPEPEADQVIQDNTENVKN